MFRDAERGNHRYNLLVENEEHFPTQRQTWPVTKQHKGTIGSVVRTISIRNWRSFSEMITICGRHDILTGQLQDARPRDVSVFAMEVHREKDGGGGSCKNSITVSSSG